MQNLFFFSSRQGMSRLYKVSMIGVKGVGKSSMMLKHVHNIFPPTYEIMYDNSFRKRFTANGDECIMDFMDPGEIQLLERFLEQYILQSSGIVLVYSVISRESFDAIGKYYHEIITRKQDAVFILVGNKCDLDTTRQVSTEEGEELANTLKCTFFEISSKNGNNIDECFIELGNQMKKYREENHDKFQGSVAQTVYKRK